MYHCTKSDRVDAGLAGGKANSTNCCQGMGRRRPECRLLADTNPSVFPLDLPPRPLKPPIPVANRCLVDL